MCKQRKTEMHDLVVRCLDLKKKSPNNEMIPACKDVLSAYCYVFSNQDTITCLLNDHDVYIPGKKATTLPTRAVVTTTRSTIRTTSPSTTTTKTTTTTRPSTAINKVPKTPFEMIPGFTGTINSVNYFDFKNKKLTYLNLDSN